MLLVECKVKNVQFFVRFLHIAVFFVVVSNSLSNGQQFPEAGSRCAVNGSKYGQGKCTPLSQCQAAISDLKSGINPTICQIRNKVAVVCCRSEDRISVKKCKKYVEFLRDQNEKNVPVPFLPLDFLGPEKKDTESPGKLCVQFQGLVVGGRDAKPDEFPHMAVLGYVNGEKTTWGCGGTLISESFVLTAAHCVDTSALGRPKKVLLGEISISQPRNSRLEVEIEEYIKHPDYKQPSSYNDIALLRLAQEIPFSRSILPACLPQSDTRPDKKNTFSTIGFGKVGFAEGQSDILQAVNLTRYNLSTCNEFYDDLPSKQLKYSQGILRKQICAGDPEGLKDSCQGDSGGPLQILDSEYGCLYHILGVTSFGSNYCGSAPGIYTNVQAYLDWIEATVWRND